MFYRLGLSICFEKRVVFAPVTQSQNAPVQQKALLRNGCAEPT